MFDNLLECKYLIIILIVALIIVLYLYSKQKSCHVKEGMHNVDFPWEKNDTIYPWARDGEAKYRSVDDYYHPENQKKLKNKYKVFEEDEDYTIKTNKNIIHEQYKFDEIYTSSDEEDNLPQPIDTRPDLAQCQKRYQCPPCNCNKDDHDFDKEFKKTRRIRKKQHKN